MTLYFFIYFLAELFGSYKVLYLKKISIEFCYYFFNTIVLWLKKNLKAYNTTVKQIPYRTHLKINKKYLYKCSKVAQINTSEEWKFSYTNINIFIFN